MLNIALFGAPGSGKGTQSRKLIDAYGLVYISTGDLLRDEMREGTELGQRARGIIERGGLVSDEIIVQIIERKIQTNQEANGFLFDGFPRTWVQAYILEGLLVRMRTELTLLCSLDVPESTCLERLLERGKTSSRSDDNENVIKYRLSEYAEKTAPVAGFYKEKGIHVSIDGTGDVEAVFNRIRVAIDGALRTKRFNVVLLGYPGSGRGTQARQLAEKFDLNYISTGDILKSEIENRSAIGLSVHTALESGTLVPDEVVIRLIEHELNRRPNARGLIFKGFPRTVVQAYILDGLLLKRGTAISLVINIDVGHLELVKRLARRATTDQAMPYDRSTETIVQRLEEHEEKTLPVLEYYRKSRAVHNIPGEGVPEEIFAKLCTRVEQSMRRVR